MSFTLTFDWWQLGWAVAGFFLVMFFVLLIGGRGGKKKALQTGYDDGYHDRQHWETDKEIGGKLERQ